ncbi:MAG: nucleotidyltransferase domain-containing protein [Tannerella sp.]|jgi:predicted nucleotidyltransferase|nr:nucleotidyltransferase domain-containing protein [Tannerella sp.]
MGKVETKIENIRESILKFVPARRIYLFGSYAYGNPTENSDIDIFVVTPDDHTNDFIDLYAKILCDLGRKDIFFIDLSFDTESSFNTRRMNRKFEKTIYQKGRVLYEQYPNKYDVIESHANIAIGAVEKIRNLKPVLEMRTVVNAD